MQREIPADKIARYAVRAVQTSRVQWEHEKIWGSVFENLVRAGMLSEVALTPVFLFLFCDFLVSTTIHQRFGSEPWVPLDSVPTAERAKHHGGVQIRPGGSGEALFLLEMGVFQGFHPPSSPSESRVLLAALVPRGVFLLSSLQPYADKRESAVGSSRIPP